MVEKKLRQGWTNYGKVEIYFLMLTEFFFNVDTVLACGVDTINLSKVIFASFRNSWKIWRDPNSQRGRVHLSLPRFATEIRSTSHNVWCILIYCCQTLNYSWIGLNHSWIGLNHSWIGLNHPWIIIWLYSLYVSDLSDDVWNTRKISLNCWSLDFTFLNFYRFAYCTWFKLPRVVGYSKFSERSPLEFWRRNSW